MSIDCYIIILKTMIVVELTSN